MTKGLTDEVADDLSMERQEVAAVIEEFMLQMHRQLFEYDESNGSYIGELMWNEVSPQAYLHFLGFLDRISERYALEPRSVHEYMARLFRPAQWRPFSLQMSARKEVSFNRASCVDISSEED
ncbi:hypothetical protein [Achromobacter spanius]|uniref:Uncharacterized protein n=1 Tax=Achromobacter spanius TaxID=217203 RepID=A0AAW3I419_9BURK|nr:hypothetical protein [Achromobacter spanius]KNE27048.1 hypothetical protein AFM18_14315 [Achromobacter spanius]